MTLTMMVFVIFTGETGKIGSAAPGMAALLFPGLLIAAIFSYAHVQRPRLLMAGSLVLAMLATADMGLASLFIASCALNLNSMGLRIALLEVEPAATRRVIYWAIAGRIVGGCLASIGAGTTIGRYAALAMLIATIGLTMRGVNARSTRLEPPTGLNFAIVLEAPMLFLMLFSCLAAALEGALAAQLTTGKLLALFPLYHSAGDAMALLSLMISPRARPQWPLLIAVYTGLFIAALALPPLASITAYGVSCLVAAYLMLEFSQWLRVRSEGQVAVSTSVSFAQSALAVIISVTTSYYWR
jgi:hypothetical protein